MEAVGEDRALCGQGMIYIPSSLAKEKVLGRIPVEKASVAERIRRIALELR